MVPSVNSNLVGGCLSFLSALLREEKIAKKRPEESETLINLYIIFAMTWSFGANLSDESRDVFDRRFKFVMETMYTGFPHEGTVYDYAIDDDMAQFVSWQGQVPSFQYNPKIPYFNILVPTVDTVRYKYLLNVLLRFGKNILFMGNTGVGKSVIVQDYLMNIS